MHSYIALLGSNPTLSVSELAAVFPSATMRGIQHGFLRFDDQTSIDQSLLNRLGGTVLIARRVTDNAVDLDDVPGMLAEELKNASGKVCFSLRFAGLQKKTANDLYKACKNELRRRGVSSRYVGSASAPALAVQLHDEGLLNPKKGAELVLMVEKNDVSVYRTIAAQNVKSYTLRDMSKPVRDTTVGLLPPKLAQIMLNFGGFLVSRTSKKSNGAADRLTMFDPFCGTGVIPMEAMLRGMHVEASDITDKAVTGSQKNIEWMRKTFGILKKDVEAHARKHDATKPFDLESLPDLVVSEGTLGPAIKARPLLKEVSDHQKKVDLIMSAFIRNAAATLPGVPVVLTLPVWYAQKKQVPLEKTWTAIEECYQPMLPPMTEPSIPGRFSLLYRRDDQFVGREIVLLKPKKA
jgi:tRNA G10  N-methylase Trm11